MTGIFEEAVKDLSNKEAGWVTRRDAAQNLGEVALKALSLLREFQQDGDTDVRQEVQRALEKIAKPEALFAAESLSYSLDEILRYVAHPELRVVEKTEAGHTIVLTTQGGRSQQVFLDTFHRSNGSPLYRLYTPCALPAEKQLQSALESNPRLPLCAFALLEHQGEEILALTATIRVKDATPKLFKTLLKAVAFYGDWFEKQLSGADNF